MEKQLRKSNIELLRIVAMIMIVLHHYSLYTGLINTSEILSNQIVAVIINLFGKLGAILFVVISGYFMVEKNNFLNNIFKTLFQLLFYSIGIYFILLLFGVISFSPKSLIYTLFPFQYQEYWFVTYYIGLCICAPFINIFINNSSRIVLKKAILVFSLFFVILPTIFVSSVNFYSGFLYFILLYFVGAYIKIYNIKITKKRNLLIVLLLFMGVISISILSLIMSRYIPILIKGSTYLSKGNTIFIYLLAIYLFLLFNNMHLNNNKIINTLGKTSFAVYLISDNPNIRHYLWIDLLKCDQFINVGVISLIKHILLSVILIYFICSCIELMRTFIFNNNIESKMINMFKKIIKFIDKKIVGDCDE